MIRPTRAYGGSRSRQLIIEPLSAWRESTSWQVSTTKRNIGGEGAGRASLYSIVVAEG